MTPRERFVHFVILFLGDYYEGMGGKDIVKEAMALPDGLFETRMISATSAQAGVNPLDGAHDFVSYRRTGANRPYWLPTA